jgi:hypothetical protein
VDVIDRFANFMEHIPIGVLLVTVLLASAPLAVLHELGHAAVALVRLPGRVIVRVGRDEPTSGFALGRVEFQLRPVMRPWRFDAICARETPGTRLDDALIALGGPAASFAVGVGAVYASGIAPAGSTLYYVVGAIAFEAISSTIVCLTPMTLSDSRGHILVTDGAHIVAALRGKAQVTFRQPVTAGRSHREASQPSSLLRKYRSAVWLVSTIVFLIALSYIVPLLR